ncbi:MAG: MotA/TolQ/ExbB proton channel family protein [Myxococcales bacterium]|nr:MotA/TolQ/ExbB proton channel family protein [Myxococcales bacterium]
MWATWQRWSSYLADGGFVMPFLAASAALLWFALGYRWLTLRRGSLRGLRALVDEARHETSTPARHERAVLTTAARRAVVVERSRPRHLRPALDDALAPISSELSRFATLARALVIVAPLLGLLGTVAGMIETFDSLADMSLFSQSGGIAGGISQALITTQMGLAVAIPGLLIGRMLARKQQRLDDELEQLKDVVCGDRTVTA